MAQLLNLTNRMELVKKSFEQLPAWFEQYWNKPVVYHRDCLIHFKIIKSAERFASGLAWFCRDCDKPVECYEDFFQEFDYFAVTKLKCRCGCGRSWHMEEVDPLIAVIAENIDWDAFEKRDGVFMSISGKDVHYNLFDKDDAPLRLKRGVLLRRIYTYHEPDQKDPDVEEVWT